MFKYGIPSAVDSHLRRDIIDSSALPSIDHVPSLPDIRYIVLDD
jgi:hypothetical protein